MMIKKLIPIFALAIFIFSSCGSDSENADINKEWTLIDVSYSGTTSAEGELITFNGLLIDGEATIQFDEDPNTIRSNGMYKLQLESIEGNFVRLARNELTFDQLGTWTRNGNTITASADNSPDLDLMISNLSEDRMQLDFDYTITTEIMGTPVTTANKGSYFLVSPDYINGLKDDLKGGWILNEIEYIHYTGTFSEVDGLVDTKSIGSFSNGIAPLNFGENGEFLASGFFSMDVETTDYDAFGSHTMATSKESKDFLRDGSYSINGRTITITEGGGNVRTFTILDATNDKLIFFELIDGEDNGPFGLTGSRTRTTYTFDRKVYEAAPLASITGDWSLGDFEYDLLIESLSGGGPFEEIHSVAILLSADANISISENPNVITSTGSYVIEITQEDSGSTTTFDNTESVFSADNWINSNNELEVFGSDFSNGSSIFVIESLTSTEMILTENIDETESAGGFDFRTTGFRTFTFVR